MFAAPDVPVEWVERARRLDHRAARVGGRDALPPRTAEWSRQVVDRERDADGARERAGRPQLARRDTAGEVAHDESGARRVAGEELVAALTVQQHDDAG